jgi:DNA-binding MarR family transcriptional regulator
MISAVAERTETAVGLMEFFGERKYMILRRFCQHAELTAPTLIRETGIGKTTVHQVVDQLVRAGFAVRVEKGRRRHVFVLTPVGEKFVEAIVEAGRPAAPKVFPMVGDEMPNGQWESVARNLATDCAAPIKGRGWSEDELSLPTSALMWDGRGVE